MPNTRLTPALLPLLAVALAAQTPKPSTPRKQVPATTIASADVPKAHLRTSEYLNNAVMAAFTRAPMQLSYGVDKEKVVAGKGYKDTEAHLNFGSTLRRAELQGSFLFAVCHNAERSPVWSLRRVRLEQGKQAGTWRVGKVAFAYRRSDAEGQPFVRLPKAAATLRTALQLLEKHGEGVHCRELTLDFSKDKPTLSAAIEVVGKDFKKRFMAFETKLSDAAKAATTKGKNTRNRSGGDSNTFADVRWRGDEEPAKGKKGATFHLDFLLTKPSK